MARRQVLEVVCDRCKKIETQEITNGEDGRGVPELTLIFQNENVKYQDLCRRCRSACEGYVKSLTMQQESKKAPEKKPLLSRLTG